MSEKGEPDGYRTQRKTPTDLGKGIQKFSKEIGIEWKGVRPKARDHKRWKAVCKPSTPTGRRGSTN